MRCEQSQNPHHLTTSSDPISITGPISHLREWGLTTNMCQLNALAVYIYQPSNRFPRTKHTSELHSIKAISSIIIKTTDHSIMPPIRPEANRTTSLLESRVSLCPVTITRDNNWHGYDISDGPGRDGCQEADQSMGVTRVARRRPVIRPWWGRWRGRDRMKIHCCRGEGLDVGEIGVIVTVGSAW